jgi:hypothetical protein
MSLLYQPSPLIQCALHCTALHCTALHYTTSVNARFLASYQVILMSIYNFLFVNVILQTGSWKIAINTY